MKYIILILFSIMIVSCGQPTVKKYSEKPPNLKELKVYALTPISKYVYDVLFKVNTDINLISSVYIDPNKDENAKLIAEKEYNEFKKDQKKYSYSLTKPEQIRQLRSIKKLHYRPFWLFTNIPYFVENAYIYEIPKNVMSSITMLGTKAVRINFIPDKNQSIDEFYVSMISELDNLFLHSKCWIKQSEDKSYQSMPDSIKKMLGDEGYYVEWKSSDLIMSNSLRITIYKKDSYIFMDIKKIVYE